MKLNNENKKMDINISHERIMQKMSDEREDRERKENHRHEEELKKMENERILKKNKLKMKKSI